MHIVLLSIAVLNFFSFGWSVIGVFTKNKDQDKIKYRILQLTSAVTWIICSIACYSCSPNIFQAVVCTLVQAGCLVAFWKTSKIVKRHKFTIAFSKDAPSKLVREGLYSKIRHPFYTIYLVSYFSIGFVLIDALAIAASLVMLWVYYDAARTEENKFLSSELANQYLEYRKETHMFAPKLSA